MESNQILKAQQTLNLNQVESNATPTSKSKLTNRCRCVCHVVAVAGPPFPPISMLVVVWRAAVACQDVTNIDIGGKGGRRGRLSFWQYDFPDFADFYAISLFLFFRFCKDFHFRIFLEFWLIWMCAY